MIVLKKIDVVYYHWLVYIYDLQPNIDNYLKHRKNGRISKEDYKSLFSILIPGYQVDV